MEREFLILMQLCLENLPTGEDLNAFKEKVGKAQIKILAVAGKRDMEKVLRKLLKKLGVAIWSRSNLEMLDFEAEINKLLS